MKSASPRISALTWGSMAVDGVGSGKDFKLWPGGGRAWDWRETGTHHSPGIQPADVAELIDHGSEAIVLSRGMLLRLQTCRETLALLKASGVAVHVAETGEAAAIYNDLAAQGVAVGGLFHSTC
ncbi:MAG: Mth938-like domain-containing protein [Gammaproteobacteria bacterium]